MELAVLGVRDNGTEIRMAMRGEPGSAAATFRFYAEAIDKVAGEVANTAQNAFGMAQREPVGVVGAIVPMEFPADDRRVETGPCPRGRQFGRDQTRRRVPR